MVEPQQQGQLDLVLSSGFLAFARHLGFLRAIEEAEVSVRGVCGTSSGALIGALWTAGLSTHEIETIITAQRPSKLLCPTPRLWRGAMSLKGLLTLLKEHLPPTFEQLRFPFAVGVCSRQGDYQLLSSGTLPEAVGASCAIPVVFEPVSVDEVLYSDGGAKDRLGLAQWRSAFPGAPTLVHLVERTAGAVDTSLTGADGVVLSPRSGASFLSLGDVASQITESAELTHNVLADLMDRGVIYRGRGD